MEERRVIYDKVAISRKALSVFIVLGLFMTALVTGYGYYLGNSGGGGVIPAAAHKEHETEYSTDALEE